MAEDLSHPRQQLDLAMVELGLDTDRAQHSLLHPRRAMDIESMLVQGTDDLFDLFFRSTWFRYDDHDLSEKSRVKQGKTY
jgi:hypothetical protein